MAYGADSEVASVATAVTSAAETAALTSDKEGLDKFDIVDCRKRIQLHLQRHVNMHFT